MLDLDRFFKTLTQQQRPYYQIQGEPIKAANGQYWLVFKHRDADNPNLLKNLISLLKFKGKPTSHRILRIDPQSARIYTYSPQQQNDIPTPTLLRTANLSILEKFLHLEGSTKEPSLLAGSLRGIQKLRRRYALPDELSKYNSAIAQMLEHSVLYRRSTAYFDSGILKLYEEPLQAIIQAEGEIRLLMDWQGFTKRADIRELEKLHDPNYRTQFVGRSLQEFLQGLEEKAFNGTEILAELIRLGFLHLKLIKMEQNRSIYHKKTGIFSDALNNHILHEGSDNFTRAAHSRNAESVTFLYSWERLDQEAIADSIQQFDQEWQRQDIAFDLSQEFLQQVLQERDRRQKLRQPKIETITPESLVPGEVNEVMIRGENLDQIDTLAVADNHLIDITITEQTSDQIKADVEVSIEHPPQSFTQFRVKEKSGGEYNVQPKTPPRVQPAIELPEFEEIEGFKSAIELILSGQHGTPKDFLYWLAQQRPHQFQVQQSDLLDTLVNQDTLMEHQKSGAQHCLRVMRNFGVAVCADAVGLGKTRLAATVARLYRQDTAQAKIAVIAARKLHENWHREMAELGFREGDYELYNKNLMSRKGNGFFDDFNRYGGADLVIIDEAHEGIRNYKNRIHKLCLQIREKDQQTGRQRHYLLLTATPWNNRREDIYNILQPFLTRPEGFTDLGFPSQVAEWFQNREIGVNNFVDDTQLFRRTYRELFLQRTRQMLRDAMPDLNVYAKRQAEWLPVQFEPDTEAALEKIFTQFETDLFIPFADPVRYLTGSIEQKGLLTNQRRFFLQRAESSMYALSRTIVNFRTRIEQMRSRLDAVTPDATGLQEFLLLHYGFDSENIQAAYELDDQEAWDEDYEEEDEPEETAIDQQEKRQQLRRTIELAIAKLEANPAEAERIYHQMQLACAQDLEKIDEIQTLLAEEFVKDHKREQVTQKVRELVKQGKRVLLISTFSDTVLDYYRYMSQDAAIAGQGIGMAIGSTKRYYLDQQLITIAPHNVVRGNQTHKGIQRQDLFRLFAPVATCKDPSQRPKPSEEIKVLIGSETLSVGQNLQDADYLINIDLPWNPMTLEQRIGRIDRPKQHHPDKIYIYYANSESQLLRQASRLSNLNKKLVGDTDNLDQLTDISKLGASIYGDTLFDDAILPGYVEFLRSLVKTRQQEQESFQETLYRNQEARHHLYTHQEILFSEDISQHLKHLGEDYQANPITLGRGGHNEPSGLAVLTVDFFGPNGEPLPDRRELLFWNDQTGTQDGYGTALATALKTPEVGDIFSTHHLLTCARSLYAQLVHLKQQRTSELTQEETIGNITLTSERLHRIQTKISTMKVLPAGMTKAIVKDTLKKLNFYKQSKLVGRLLHDYADGAKANLEPNDFVLNLVAETEALNLLGYDTTQPVSLKLSLSALLLRA